MKGNKITLACSWKNFFVHDTRSISLFKQIEWPVIDMNQFIENNTGKNIM